MRSVRVALVLALFVFAAVVVAAGCGGDDDDDDSSGDGSGKPDTLPNFSDLNLYSEDSPFNTPLTADAAVDPDSDTMIETLIEAEPMLLIVQQFSAPVFFAQPDTAPVSVALPCGEEWEIGVSSLTGAPIPPWAEPSNDVDGGGIPTGCGEDSGRDDHMIVLDLENRCEYDFWQMRGENGGWTASWANAISMDSLGVYPAGLSTRGSGFAFLGGLIWPDELVNGEINHALAMSYPFTRSGGPVAPATDSDGITSEAGAIPEGALLRLDPSLDLDAIGLDGITLTIARAMQEWGVYMVDTGGDDGIGIYAVDSISVTADPYDGLFSDADYVDLSDIPADRFQVLELGPQDGDWEDSLDLVDTGCNVFE